MSSSASHLVPTRADGEDITLEEEEKVEGEEEEEEEEEDRDESEEVDYYSSYAFMAFDLEEELKWFRVRWGQAG